MTPGEVVLKSGGIFRLTESASDGFIDTFYQRMLDDLSALLNEYSVEELAAMVANSKQLNTQEFDQKMFLAQADVDKLRALEPRPRTEADEFWAMLEELPEKLDEWTEDDLEELAMIMVGSTDSLSFNLRAQMLSGLFLQYGYPYEEMPTEAEFTKRFGGDDYSLLIDFDDHKFIFRQWDVTIVLNFEGIRELAPNLQELYDELDEE